MNRAHPFDAFVAALRARGCAVRPRNVDAARATCPCPTHRDRRPSLSITRRDETVLFHCFGGCRQRDVLRALDLRPGDLFTAPPRRGDARIVAVYRYEDERGVVAEKVRLEPKTFRWRVPAPSAALGYRWGLHGATPGLYRVLDLTDAHEIFVVEGEKAVETLRALGLVATCPSAGASTWRAEWSVALWRSGAQDVVVLPDNDRAGGAHAERVAATSSGIVMPNSDDDTAAWPAAALGDPELTPLRVKVVALREVPAGGDVCDWLNAGHSIDELRDLAAAAPLWAPRDVEQERIERRRALTRDRVRRHRAAQRAAQRVVARAA